MLTDDDKTRIREEEIFRQEIRRQIEPRPEKKSALWTLLNSSFTLWFLSTVVVAALTAAITAYRNASTEEAQKVVTERKLVTEMGHRIFHAAEGLRVMETNVGRGSTYLPATVYLEMMRFLNNDLADEPGVHRDLSIYPELRERTLRSMLVELSTVTDTTAHRDIRDALVAVETFGARSAVRDVDAADTVDSSVRPQESLAAIRDASKIVADKLNKPRWRLAVLEEN